MYLQKNNRNNLYSLFFVMIIGGLFVGYYFFGSNKGEYENADITQVTIDDSASQLSDNTLGEGITNEFDEVIIRIAGDVMLARSIGTGIENGRDPFTDVSEKLKSADIAVINLECVISDKGSPYPGKLYTFEAPVKSIDYIKNSGIDLVSVANNHSGDYSHEAFEDMLSRLKADEIDYVGGGLNADEAYKSVVYEIDELKIAFLAFSNVETEYFSATSVTSGLAWMRDELVQEVITKAKSESDVLVVYNHWGYEYQTSYSVDQQITGRTMIDMGADLVVGTHPHVRQGFEEYQGKMIYYSLGNFVFDVMNSYDASNANILEIRIDQEKNIESELFPVVLSEEGYPRID